MDHLHIAIMAGGGGTRFWPASRDCLPKQFLQLLPGKSMIRVTFDRVLKIVPPERVWVLTSCQYQEYIAKELFEMPVANILVEPMRRDTSAAIMLGAVAISQTDPKAVMAVMPSDHLIAPDEEFIRCVKVANEYLQYSDCLCTFGIVPSQPSPNFGYIKKGLLQKELNQLEIFDVLEFVEKPSPKIAKQYLDSGQYFWNSGIFIWKTATILEEIRKYLPKHKEAIEALANVWKKQMWSQVVEEVFAKLPSISIDYAVLEKASSVVFIKTSFEWNDVGSWDTLENVFSKDPQGNVHFGKHLDIDSHNCIVYSPKHLTATIGLRDIVVVATDDAILVTTKKMSSKVKDLTKLLKEKDMLEYL